MEEQWKEDPRKEEGKEGRGKAVHREGKEPWRRGTCMPQELNISPTERQAGALGSGGCEDFQGRQGFLKFVTQKTLIIRWQDGSLPHSYDGVHQLPKMVL